MVEASRIGRVAECVQIPRERIRLTEQVTALEEQLKKKEADLEDYVKQAQKAAAARTGGNVSPSGLPPIAPAPKPGWINEHVEKGARSLDAPAKPSR